RLPEVLKASDYYIALYDADTGTITFPVAQNDHRQVEIPPRKLGMDEISYVLKNNRMLSIGADYFTPEQLRISIGIENGEGDYQSFVAVPISAGARTLGAVALRDDTRIRAFSLNDQRVLTTVSSQLAAVLQNASLFQQISQLAEDLERQVVERTYELMGERDRLDTLYQITSELARTLDMSALEKRSLGMLINAIGADDGLIMRFDPVSGELLTMARYHDHDGLSIQSHPGEQIGRWLIKDQGELVIPDLKTWPHWDASQPGAGDWGSAMAATLTASEGEPLGVLILMSLF